MKLWRIDLEAAQRNLKITLQHSKQTDNLELSRNYRTNSRMLRYKPIHVHFFMDTFFATARANKLPQGNTCCQLFVTDKGYVYVVPMAKQLEVIQALQQFAKEIWAPDAIVCDMSGA